MDERQEELDEAQGRTSSAPQTSEEVARAVVAAAAAVRPRPSIVFTSNISSSNKALERFQKQCSRIWRRGFGGETHRQTYFNPEDLTSQKRLWSRLQLQRLESKQWIEPSRLFEHMVLVGLHPEVDTQALDAALLRRRTWERELDGPERLKDVVRQQFCWSSPPVPDPEILYTFPPGKKLPMRQKDLLAFCYPGGVEAHLVERTPSSSELNEIVYGQDHVMRDDRSYVFLLKVADNATLYGVCVYVPQLVKQLPGIMALNSNSRLKSSPVPISRFCLTTYRCYCLLTKYPFFDLHFEVLNSIITQERLDRITDCVNEMSINIHKNAVCGFAAETNGISPTYTEQSGFISPQGADSFPSTEHVMEGAVDQPREPRRTDFKEQHQSGDGLAALGSDREHDSVATGSYGESMPAVSQDPLINNVSAEMKGATMIHGLSNGELLPNILEIKMGATVKQHMGILGETGLGANLDRADSFESLNSICYSFRQSATSDDDDDAEEGSIDGLENNFLSQLELVDHCLLQILCGYYKHPVPARGSSIVFQPLEHLPPLKFTRTAGETSALLGGRIIDPKLCKSSLDMVEVQSALTAAEEAGAISIWSVATVCRVLSLENVMALFASMLLEKQLVIVCPNLGVLSAVVLSTMALIRPFQWQSLMLPILPNQLLDFLEAPVPYVVGVLQKSSALRSKSSNVVVFNIQRNKVSMPYMPPLPYRRELSSALEPFHTKLAAEAEFSRKHPVHVFNNSQNEAAQSFLAVLRSYLESLCRNLRSHTITNVQSNNDKVSLLLKDSFVEDFESKDHAFMKFFVDTQLFSVHTDAVLSYIESS